jgi:hypothetical protein
MGNASRRSRRLALSQMKHRDSWFALMVMAAALIVLPVSGHAQRRGRGQNTESAKAAAAVDLTGEWISVVTEDWKFRMVTPRKGDYDLVPLTPAGKSLADAWDPAKDEAANQQCRSYGAAAIMRAPGRLRVTWDNDNTLRIDFEAGTQTRLFRFGQQTPPNEAASWQGYSSATWEYGPTGRGSARTGNLKAVTSHLRPGYLRKNGVPYSENAVVTEHFRRIATPNGDEWLLVITEVNDPQYLNVPFVTSTQFKKVPTGSSWKPEPCTAR